MPGDFSYSNHGKTYGFNFGALRRHPGVTPIVAIIGTVIVGVTAFTGYALMTKTDVQVVNKHRWDEINLDDPAKQKLFTFNQQYRPMTELSQLLKEINEADK